jgi:exonuclease III
MAVAADFHDTPLLLIGDLNTGCNETDIEGNGTPFACEGLFLDLERQAGLRDLWRAEHKDKRESSWLSRPHRNGFRLDHAFGNRALFEQMGPVKTRYDHGTRNAEGAITDHSALIVDIAASH